MNATTEELRRITHAEREAQLEDLLSRWWASLTPMRLADGHSRSACGFESYTTSRQYDDVNGALDDHIEARITAQVGVEVLALADPWRSAINALARSLCTGHAVFHSPRIQPADRARVTLEARAKLMARLVAAGIM